MLLYSATGTDEIKISDLASPDISSEKLYYKIQITSCQYIHEDLNCLPQIPFYIYSVPLPTQLHILISSFKNVNKMKTFVCDYHLNDYLSAHQIQVCNAHARKLALGYKYAFSVLDVHGLVICQHRAQIQNLLRPPDEFMKTGMSKFVMQWQ